MNKKGFRMSFRIILAVLILQTIRTCRINTRRLQYNNIIKVYVQVKFLSA